MSDQEVMDKAIQKAFENGFSRFDYERPELEYFDEIEFCITWHDPLESDHTKQSYHSIFDHDFAKALWGEEHDCGAGYHPETEVLHVPSVKLSNGSEIPARDEIISLGYYTFCFHGDQKNWQYHIQQMVIADDPIKYLGENS